jgi:hypothetical protein
VKHFDDAGQLLSEKVFSDMPDVAGDPTPMVDYNVMVEIKDVGGATVAKSRHYFYYSPGDELIFPYVPMGFGKEHKTEVIDPGSGVILRKAEITLKQREPFPWCNGGIFNFYTCDNTTAPDAGPANDPRITEEVTTLETGQVSKKTFSYDIYNNVTDTYEYDYGSGQAGQSLLRRTHTDYVTDPNYTTYTATYLPGCRWTPGFRPTPTETIRPHAFSMSMTTTSATRITRRSCCEVTSAASTRAITPAIRGAVILLP